MSYPNGRIPASALTFITPTERLLNPVAAAYKTLVLVGALEQVTIRPASGVGSAYRDLAMQSQYWLGAHGDPAAARRVGLSTASSVTVAAPGSSSHGDGRKIDLVFNGSDRPTEQQLALAARYGFTRQFGADDPNHFTGDGKNRAVSESDRNRVVAAWLNEQRLGRTTTTDQDGVWPATSNFSMMLQLQGHKDKLYPTPQYEIDGVAGNRTKWLRDHYWSILLKAA